MLGVRLPMRWEEAFGKQYAGREQVSERHLGGFHDESWAGGHLHKLGSSSW